MCDVWRVHLEELDGCLSFLELLPAGLGAILSPPVTHEVRAVRKLWVGWSIADAKGLPDRGEGNLLEHDGGYGRYAHMKGCVDEGDDGEGS